MEDLKRLVTSRVTWGIGFIAGVAALLANLDRLGPLKAFFVIVLFALLLSAPITLLVRRDEDAEPEVRRAAYLGLALIVLGGVSLLIHPASRDWLLASQDDQQATGSGLERLAIEAGRFERGDLDNDGQADRMRVRFDVRNVGTGPALIDRVLIGYHPGARIGGGNYSHLWLDGDILAVDDEGMTRTYTVAQRDTAAEAYHLPVHAHVSSFGGCGYDEIVEVRPAGSVEVGQKREFEINLPIELRLSSGSVDDEELTETGGAISLFLPPNELYSADSACLGIEPLYSITVSTTGKRCETVVLDAATLEGIEITDIYDVEYYDTLCTATVSSTD